MDTRLLMVVSLPLPIAMAIGGQDFRLAVSGIANVICTAALLCMILTRATDRSRAWCRREYLITNLLAVMLSTLCSLALSVWVWFSTR